MSKKNEDRNAKIIAYIVTAAILGPIIFLILHFVISYSSRPEWQKELEKMPETQLLQTARQYYLTDTEKYNFVKKTYNIACQIDSSSSTIGAEAEQDIFCKFTR